MNTLIIIGIVVLSLAVYGLLAVAVGLAWHRVELRRYLWRKHHGKLYTNTYGHIENRPGIEDGGPVFAGVCWPIAVFLLLGYRQAFKHEVRERDAEAAEAERAKYVEAAHKELAKRDWDS